MSTGDVDSVARREQFANALIKGMIEPKIAVVGIGGAGNNIISSVHARSGSKQNVHTVAINTDEASLQKVNAHTKLLVGKDVTQGKGTNGYPEVGEFCGECAKEAIRDVIQNKDIVFVVAGMGGGTGTGIAPIVAKMSKEMKSFTFIIAINPFSFEKERAEKAKEGVAKLKAIDNNMCVIDNDTLLETAENEPLSKAFGMIDNNVIKAIDSFCAQTNKTFQLLFQQEVDHVMANMYGESVPSGGMPEVAPVPEIIVTSRPPIAIEAKQDQQVIPQTNLIR